MLGLTAHLDQALQTKLNKLQKVISKLFNESTSVTRQNSRLHPGRKLPKSAQEPPYITTLRFKPKKNTMLIKFY